jgi:hypothetical protein
LLYRPLSRRSSLGAKKVRPPAAPRGTIEIFCTGSYSGISAPTSAWPACAARLQSASHSVVRSLFDVHAAPSHTGELQLNASILSEGNNASCRMIPSHHEI